MGEMTGNRHYWPAGSARTGSYAVDLSPDTVDDWSWTSLAIVDLEPGERHTFATGEQEMFVLPLAGAATVECDGERFGLQGRRTVFSRVTDSVYVPRDAEVVLTADSEHGGRYALPGARCTRRLPTRYRPAEDVPVEVRGSGNATRQVNNVGSADSFEADRLIAVEVITPAGNWSSYPPHKHDEDRPGVESELEEVYYFEVDDGGSGDGFAFHRVYGTPDRPIDVLAEVHSGDVVLIPHGWHGPSVAPPGYHLYYLNVMAGPGAERRWLICDDPTYAWVRDQWAHQEQDPRLPLSGSAAES